MLAVLTSRIEPVEVSVMPAVAVHVPHVIVEDDMLTTLVAAHEIVPVVVRFKLFELNVPKVTVKFAAPRL